MKVYSRFLGLSSNRQNPFNITLHQGQKLKRWQLLHKKNIVRETNFHIWDTWSIRALYDSFTELYDFRQKTYILILFILDESYILVLSILDVSTFWAIPLGVMWLWISAYVVKLQVWYFVFQKTTNHSVGL